MSEWLYANAGQIPPISEDLWLDLANVDLAPPVRAFHSNIEQIRRFWELPPFIMEILSLNLNALTETAMQLTGKPRLNPEEAARLHDQIIRETKARVEEKVKAVGFEAATQYNFARAITAFSGLVNEVAEIDPGIRAVMSSQLVLVWTAFETLCGDLARTADRICNNPLALSEDQSFQSLRKIRQAYSKLFADDAAIEGIVGHNALRRLNIIRNLFTHRAGVIDQKSIDHANDIGWDGLNGGLDKPVPLDGEVVRLLGSPAVTLGVELIRAVDRRTTARLKEQNRI